VNTSEETAADERRGRTMDDTKAKLICGELGFSWEDLTGERAMSGGPDRQDFRRAVAALEKYQKENVEQQRAHMASELYNLAHGGDSQ
jgi:hypothetical protein